MIEQLSINLLVKYYWIICPLFTIFSGEFSMVLFGVLSTRFLINYWILLMSSAIFAAINEQIIFLIPQYFSSFLNKYRNHPIYKYILAINYYWGGVLFIFSRFFPILRIIVPMALGSTNMPSELFLLVNCVASFLWCYTYINMGIYLGKKTSHLGWQNVLIIVQDTIIYYKNILLWSMISIIILGLLITYFKKNNNKNI